MPIIFLSKVQIKRAYNINLATAYSEGKWQRVQDNKKFFPLMRYDSCNSRENRPLHCSWNGMVLPVDHPWWPLHFPVKEPGCNCGVRAMTEGEVERAGIKTGLNGSGQAPPEGYKSWFNERTGKTERVPVGVHPMFNYPMGGEWVDRLAEYASERLNALPEALRDSVGMGMRSIIERARARPEASRFISELRKLADEGGLDKSLLADAAALSDVSRYINAIGQGGRIADEIKLGGLYGSTVLLHELAEVRELGKSGFDIYDPADVGRIVELFGKADATHQPGRYIPFHLAALRAELEYAQVELRRRGVEAELGMIAKALYRLDIDEAQGMMTGKLQKMLDELDDLGIRYPWGLPVPKELADALQV